MRSSMACPMPSRLGSGGPYPAWLTENTGAAGPATSAQRALVAEALHALEAAGGYPAGIPPDLTAGRAYTLYKDFVRQRTRRISSEQC